MALKIAIPEAGDTLTVNCDIITIGGQIVLEKGEKVIISETVIEKVIIHVFVLIFFIQTD